MHPGSKNEFDALNGSWVDVDGAGDAIATRYSIYSGVKDQILSQWQKAELGTWNTLALYLMCFCYPRDPIWEPRYGIIRYLAAAECQATCSVAKRKFLD